ncbi:hypothetical protein ACWC0C_39130 [Streptomyces sp. NPDC001709]
MERTVHVTGSVSGRRPVTGAEAAAEAAFRRWVEQTAAPLAEYPPQEVERMLVRVKT